jgi:hypothetical protein
VTGEGNRTKNKTNGWEGRRKRESEMKNGILNIESEDPS